MTYGNDIAPIAVTEPFGPWLLTQEADRRFPSDGDPDIVRRHLSDNQAEGDMLEAVDDAETIWLCL